VSGNLKFLTGHARRATRVKIYKDNEFEGKDNEVEGMKTAGDLDKDEA
jgi:hypothetical protein